MSETRFLSHSAYETQQLAKTFASQLRGGETIALYGDLGAGKTTFVQGIAIGFGILKRVQSPTFVLMRSYPIKKNGKKNLHHVDLYRIESADQIQSIDLKELIENPNNITIIEWAEKVEELLPIQRINIYFDNKGRSIREIRIKRN